MRTTTRFKIFETNSSSTHTLVILNQQDMDALKREEGDGWIKRDVTDPHERKFFTAKEIVETEEFKKWRLENPDLEKYNDTDDSWVYDYDKYCNIDITVPSKFERGTLYRADDPYDNNLVDADIVIDTEKGPLYIIIGEWMS